MSWRRALEIAAIVLVLAAGAAVRTRVCRDWVFFGSDSYAYERLGDEWIDHGRFALGPAEPLEWYRRPLYPLFVGAVRYDTRADSSGGQVMRAQLAIDLLTGVMALLVARRLGGRIAGLLALALTMLHPAMVVYSCTILTESPMALLTTAMLACLVAGSRRPRVFFPVAAVFVALAAYLRPDGPLNAIAFIPALFVVYGWRRRASLAAVCLALFVALFAPWPIRNVVRFSAPHVADGMVDRFGHDVPNYAGFWRWLQTWARDQSPAGQLQSCFYDSRCHPSSDVWAQEGAFLAPAGDADAERRTVDQLLLTRLVHGITPEVSDGFAALARRRRAAHPWRVLVALPLERAWHMWLAPQSEPLDNPGWRPWPSVFNRIYPQLERLSLALIVGVVAAALALLALRRTRLAAAVVVTLIVARTAALGWSAFCLPRYLMPIYPACFALVGGAAGVALAALARVIRRTIAASRSQRHSGPRVTSASSS